MDLDGFRKSYYERSGKASDVARQLSFAGIALIWIFKAERGGPDSVPTELYLPAVLFVVALALDLLQYAWGAFIWGAFCRYKEKKGVNPNAELVAPPWFNWPALACFWLKLAAVVAAYWLVFNYIRKLIFII